MPSDAHARRQGFTLIELMIVVAIMGVLVAPLIYLEIQYSERLYSNLNRMEMAEAGNRCLEWIARDIRSAESILEKWRDQPLAADRLILLGGDGSVIVYSFDKDQKLMARTQYSRRNPEALPQRIVLARNVEDFRIDPVNPNQRLFHLQLRLSRELLNLSDTIFLSGSAARRIP